MEGVLVASCNKSSILWPLWESALGLKLFCSCSNFSRPMKFLNTLAYGSLHDFRSLLNHLLLHGLDVLTKEAISSIAASGLISRNRIFSNSVSCYLPGPLLSGFDHFYLARASLFFSEQASIYPVEDSWICMWLRYGVKDRAKPFGVALPLNASLGDV